MGVRAPSSGLHLSASPGWQQQSKMIFQGSEIVIVSSEPYPGHPPQQCSAQGICLLCLCLGSDLSSWSEKYFGFMLLPYSCFEFEILGSGLLPCLGTGKQRLLLGLRGKTSLCCHWNLNAVRMCLWWEYLPYSNFSDTIRYHWYLQGDNIQSFINTLGIGQKVFARPEKTLKINTAAAQSKSLTWIKWKQMN